MRVRVLVSNSALPMARAGYTRVINDDLARHLIQLGYVEPVEEAVVAAPETATLRPRRRGFRKFP